MCYLFITTYLLLLVVSSIESRIISEECIIKVDGSSCSPIDRSWQHDGVCQYKAGKYERCVAPDTRQVELLIIARHRSLSLRQGPAVKDMYIRGTGPGLSWEDSIKMSKSATAIDVWSLKLSYTIDSDGLPCIDSSHCTLNQQALEFRIYKDSFGSQGMKGPNFYIPLPTVSNSISGALSFRIPSVTVYPWFNGEIITQRSFTVKASPMLVPVENEINFNCTLMYPPSYDENVRKKYELVIIFGRSDYYRQLLEYLFVHEGSVNEVIVLMVDPIAGHQYSMLPFDNFELHCQGVSQDCSNCQTCWATNRLYTCEKEEFIAKSKLCLFQKSMKGIGGYLMESTIKELTQRVSEYISNRLLYDPPKHRLTLIGHTDMGVSIFSKAITSPEYIKNVASFSPSFFYPLDTKYKLHSQIFQVIENEGQKINVDPSLQYLHSSQKYYIDIGEGENFFFPLDDFLVTTDLVIDRLKEKLKLEDHTNIIHHTIANQRLSFMTREPPDVLSRLKFPFLAFHGAGGSLNKDYVRTIKVSPGFIAERQGSLSSNNDGSQGGSVINIISTGGVNGTGNRTVYINVGGKGNCTTPTKCKDPIGIPLGVFLGGIGASAAVSVIITVILMCLREGSRRAAEKEEKEERELLEELSSDDDFDDF